MMHLSGAVPWHARSVPSSAPPAGLPLQLIGSQLAERVGDFPLSLISGVQA
jgi:hypothetical protein